MNLTNVLVGVIFVVFIGFANFFIYKSLVKRAIRKKIKPYLYSLEYEFIELKYRGLFYHGNFNPNSSSLIMNPDGKSKQSIYQELIYRDKIGELKSVTARIDNEFMFLTNVFFYPQIK